MKTFRTIFFALLLGTGASAQGVGGGYLFNPNQTTTGASTTINVLTGAITNHALTFVPIGTPGTITINIEGSAKGDFSDTAVCATSSSTSPTTITCSGVYSKVRVNVTTLTGFTGVGWTYLGSSGSSGTASTVAGSLSDNGAAATNNRIADLPATYQTSYRGGTAGTAGNNAALQEGTDGLLWAAQLPAIRPCSYTASAKFAASSTTDIAVLPGNASNTILVTEVRLSGIQTTAGMVNVEVAKRSTADTAGTSAAMTAVPEDSNCAAAISAPLSYTGTGPTIGTAVGDVDNLEVGFMASGTAAPNDVYILNLRQKPIVLRGTAQQLAINLGGAVTGGTVTVTWKWIETATITP